MSEVIHPISQHLKPLPRFKTAHELFGVSKPTFFHHHPLQFTIIVLPMTILAKMNKMVLQRRKVPIGLEWPDPDELEWRSVTPDMIESRWQADLLEEKERMSIEFERKL